MTIWIVPAALAVIAVVPVLLGLRRMAEEAAALVAELTRVRDLRPALIEVRDDAAELRAALAERVERARTSPLRRV